ncbi:MAG: hypothetical protein ACXACG_15525 [Candidatus Thorarchaeota archaeon]
MEEQRYPVFHGSTADYVAQMSTFTKKRQKKLYDNAREEFDVIVKTYWYTNMITGLVHSSYLRHHDNDDDVFTKHFVKWAGLWFRVIESLNVLQDSMILGLEGRTSSAFSLLRPALESIVSGAFYYCVSQSEYRDKAHKIRKADSGRRSGKILDLVEEVIRTTEDKDSIPAELERQITRMSMESKDEIHLPKIRLMLDQIEEWEIVDVESDQTLTEILYSKLFSRLSEYSHSVYHASYAGRGIESKNHDVLFGWDVDLEKFKEYANHFRFLCITILHFFLNLTEEIQKTSKYCYMMSEYIKENPEIRAVLGSVPDQILKFIESIIEELSE